MPTHIQAANFRASSTFAVLMFSQQFLQCKHAGMALTPLSSAESTMQSWSSSGSTHISLTPNLPSPLSSSQQKVLVCAFVPFVPPNQEENRELWKFSMPGVVIWSHFGGTYFWRRSSGSGIWMNLFLGFRVYGNFYRPKISSIHSLTSFQKGIFFQRPCCCSLQRTTRISSRIVYWGHISVAILGTGAAGSLRAGVAGDGEDCDQGNL